MAGEVGEAGRFRFIASGLRFWRNEGPGAYLALAPSAATHACVITSAARRLAGCICIDNPGLVCLARSFPSSQWHHTRCQGYVCDNVNLTPSSGFRKVGDNV